jgi:hypothetical protein
MFGFFKQQNSYRIISKLFSFLIGFYVLGENGYAIAKLMIDFKEDEIESNEIVISKIFGFYVWNNIIIEFFPFSWDFCLFMLLSVFTMLISKQKTINESLEKSKTRLGLDEDLLTIPEDISEFRGRFARASAA